jgi:hypothetical protein
VNDGISFEGKVERWLQRRGATFTERRVRLRGRVAKHGHEVDVHAAFGNGAWRVFAGLSAFMFVTVVLGLALSEDAFTVIGVIGLVGFTIVTIAFAVEQNHIWIECKSGEGTVRRDVVWKLSTQVTDVREERAAWIPKEAWLVARSQFDVDALRFARDHGIRCFVEQSGDIREVV